MLRLIAQSHQLPLRGMRRPRSLMGVVSLQQQPLLANHSTAAPGTPSQPPPPPLDISDTEEDLTQAITRRKPRAASTISATSTPSTPLDASSAPSGAAGGSGGGGGGEVDTPSALYTISQYHRDRRMVSDFTRCVADGSFFPLFSCVYFWLVARLLWDILHLHALLSFFTAPPHTSQHPQPPHLGNVSTDA